jgi:hypothetical protein
MRQEKCLFRDCFLFVWFFPNVFSWQANTIDGSMGQAAGAKSVKPNTLQSPDGCDNLKTGSDEHD